jgi:hypothetical protein
MNKEKKSRRGRAKKKDKQPAVFVPGSAAGPAIFDCDKIASDPSLYWETGDGDNFLVESKRGENGSTERTWNRWPKEAVKMLLREKHCIALAAREGERTGDFDRVILHVRQNRIVDLSTHSIAGYTAGLHNSLGRSILVRRSSPVIEPKQGDCSLYRTLIESRLNLDDGAETPGPQQAVFFYAWLRASLESRLNGKPGQWRPGQILVLAGDSGCGKSLIQHFVITPILGGRSANPESYLFGGTDFNAELAAAEHLLMEDPATSTRDIDRIHFGEKLKQMAVAYTFRMHRKREDAVPVEPFFRLSISVNNDPDKLRVLPLLTPDFKEKLMLFLVSDDPIPFELDTMTQRTEFTRKMKEQAPAFAWWLLNEFEIPAAMRHKRYGVRQWLHPGLAQGLFDDTPAAELLAIIDAARWTDAVMGELALWQLDSRWGKSGETWGDSGMELQRLLEDSTFNHDAARLLRYYRIERLLSRLAKDEPDRVMHHRTGMQRGWSVAPPASE